MVWLKIDAALPWHDKVVGLPNDTARFGYVKVLCIAKQRGDGRFSRAALTEALGSHAKIIPALEAARLLDRVEDGWEVHNFNPRQSPEDPTARDRQQRHRENVSRRDGDRDNVRDVARDTEGEKEREKERERETPVTDEIQEPPQNFLGFPPRKPKPGSHDGQHPDCIVCAPLRAPVQ